MNHQTGINLHETTSTLSKELTDIILESFGDKQKRLILSVLSGKALSFKEIVRESHIPIASCYRKIQELLQQGLLVRNVSIDSKKNLVPTFKQRYSQIRIDIDGNKIIVNISAHKR